MGDGEGLPPPRSKMAARNVIRLFVPAWNMWYSFSGYVEVNVRKDLCVEHPMYLLMDKDSRLAMTTLNAVNDFFVKLGDMFNAYLEQKRIEDIPAVPRASDGEADLDPWS